MSNGKVSASDYVKAIAYIANEAHKHPDESIRDMANEAIDLYDLHLGAEFTDDGNAPIAVYRGSVKYSESRSW